MTAIILSEREREALVRLIEASLGGLRFEAARIDRHRDATPLWEDEHVLVGLLERLHTAEAASIEE